MRTTNGPFGCAGSQSVDVLWRHTENISAPGEDRTHDLQMARVVIMRLTRYLLRYRGRWPGTFGEEIGESGQNGQYFRLGGAVERAT